VVPLPTENQDEPSQCWVTPALPTAHTSPVLLPQTALRLWGVPALKAVHTDPSQWSIVPADPTDQMSAGVDPHTDARGFACGSGLVQHQPS